MCFIINIYSKTNRDLLGDNYVFKRVFILFSVIILEWIMDIWESSGFHQSHLKRQCHEIFDPRFFR
jgi:hypothetical protein